jgi:uncharacterized membrane protein YcfT
VLPDLDVTTNAAFLLFTFLSPALVAFVKQSGWSTQVNAIVALVVYVAIGVLAVVLSGLPVNAETLTTHIATAMVVGMAAYKMFWSQLGAKDEDGTGSIDDRITSATSIVK